MLAAIVASRPAGGNGVRRRGSAVGARPPVGGQSQPFFLNRQNSTRQIVAMPVTTIG